MVVKGQKRKKLSWPRGEEYPAEGQTIQQSWGDKTLRISVRREDRGRGP